MAEVKYAETNSGIAFVNLTPTFPSTSLLLTILNFFKGISYLFMEFYKYISYI